jgi:hypothetical protein
MSNGTDDLVAAIQDALGAAVAPSLTSSVGPSDLYEAYVFGIVLDAARDLNATIEYRNIQGPTNQFIFRTSPGYIFSGAQPYTYARIEFAGRPILEAHLGVLVEGRSQVLHECDVAVLHHTEAETCRRNGVHPRSSKLVLAVECKYYAVPLPLSQARSFMGLGVDLGTKGSQFVINTNSDSIEKLLAHHGRNWEHQLYPGSADAVGRLRGSFQNVFKNFIATH